MQDSVREGYSFEEACSELGLEPPMLRRLLKTFGEEIGWRDEEPEASSRYVSIETFAKAKVITPLYLEGLDKQQISTRLALSAAQDLEDTEQSDAVEMLLLRIEKLESDIQKLEQKLGEDRDKMLTTIARLQQEVQRINGELALASSRRARKRRSPF